VPKHFFEATNAFRAQHIALFDFAYPAVAALWNLRWQVRGYVETKPDVSETELRDRFVAGSGLNFRNLRRVCIEHTWEQQLEDFARIMLISIFSLYEGWLEETLRRFPSPKTRANELQYPSASVGTRGKPGVREALQNLTSDKSPAMEDAFTAKLRALPRYSLSTIDNLMILYRCFKEFRNSYVHSNGIATDYTEAAYNSASGLTAADVGMRKPPEIHAAVEGQPVKASFSGVIGLSEVILQIVTTLDAELSSTQVAEEYFLDRWRQKHRLRTLSNDIVKRNARVKILAAEAGLLRPDPVEPIYQLLREHTLVF